VLTERNIKVELQSIYIHVTVISLGTSQPLARTGTCKVRGCKCALFLDFRFKIFATSYHRNNCSRRSKQFTSVAINNFGSQSRRLQYLCLAGPKTENCKGGHGERGSYNGGLQGA